jgi:hypothetical protein
MIETHDVFLRALAVPVEKKTAKTTDTPPESYAADEPKWRDTIIAFDHESRTTVDQSPTFGVWERCKLSKQNYRVIEEGIFYADDLPRKDLKVLKTYMETAMSDVQTFPPRFPLYSRTQFMKKVFWPALKRDGAMVVGFNLGYDLARTALDWKEGDKGEWSLVLMEYADGNENCNYPRILITPIDSKKQIIKLWLPWKRNQHEWKDAGRRIHFLDLRTLLWALYNKSHSLRTACDNKNGPFKGQNLPQKDEHAPTGEVTPEEIEHCRQDVRCTVALLNACKQEFDKHTDIDLKPWDAYSPASLAKAYLKAMGIERPAVKFKISDNELARGVQSYSGGRSECGIRHEIVPVVPVDFTSEYPSCCANLGLFKFLTAETLSFVDDTATIKRFVTGITYEKCFERETWLRTEHCGTHNTAWRRRARQNCLRRRVARYWQQLSVFKSLSSRTGLYCWPRPCRGNDSATRQDSQRSTGLPDRPVRKAGWNEPCKTPWESADRSQRRLRGSLHEDHRGTQTQQE